MATYIGTATSRIDGRAKVTGAARYAGEFDAEGLVHASLVAATIAKGRIAPIDAAAALAVEGFLDVLTHANRPAMASTDSAYKDDLAPDGSPTGRSTTTASCSAARRERWWSPKSRRSPASPLRSSASNTRRRRIWRTCAANMLDSSPCRRPMTRLRHRHAAATRRRPAPPRRCVTAASITSRSSITTR